VFVIIRQQKSLKPREGDNGAFSWYKPIPSNFLLNSNLRTPHNDLIEISMVIIIKMNIIFIDVYMKVKGCVRGGMLIIRL
jgi:hypothetical protein